MPSASISSRVAATSRARAVPVRPLAPASTTARAATPPPPSPPLCRRSFHIILTNNRICLLPERGGGVSVGVGLDEIDLVDHDRFQDRVPHEWFELLRREAPVFRHPAPADGSLPAF